jgi:hypothetical protein
VNDRTAIRIVEIAVVVAVGAILLSEALVYVPPGPGGVAVSVSLTGNANGLVTVNYSLRSGVLAHFHAGIYFRNATEPFSALYYYFDPAYPTSYSSLQWWYGLGVHLTAIAAARNYHLSVVYLNASQLATFLREPPVPGTALVDASGVLPHTVFNDQRTGTSNGTNLVEPWIQRGGNLLWLGDRIGLWSGFPDQNLSYSASSMGWMGTAEFQLGPSLFGGMVTWVYNNRSVDSNLFNFQEASSIPQRALNLTVLLGNASSGSTTLIGNIANNFTNAAILPQGQGRLAYFAVPIAGNTPTLAYSLMNMLQAGLFEANTTTLATNIVTVPAGISTSGTWTVYLSALTSSEVCYVLDQTDYLATFGYVTCVPSAALRP